MHSLRRAWDEWDGCPDASFDADELERAVDRAFVARCGFKILTEAGVRSGDPARVWVDATLPEKKRLLRLAIDKVVIARRVDDVAEAESAPPHDLRIEWKGGALGGDLVVLAEPPAPPPPRGHRVKVSRYQKLRAYDLEQLLTSQQDQDG